MRQHYQIIIVGGGIAGASLAYFLARRGLSDVLLLEREEQPGTQATGRSAAVLCEFHREPEVHRLIASSGRFLRQPPPELAEHPLVDEVGVLVVAGGAAWAEVQTHLSMLREGGTSLQVLTRERALETVPVLRPEVLDGGLFLDRGGHLDVHSLLSGYLRGFRQAGGKVRCRTEVHGFLVEGGRCRGVITEAGELRASWVVNAAGAWAGELAVRAGASPLTLVPKRRTIITFAAPASLQPSRWPMVDHEALEVYFKPESGGFLASPMDETPLAPCDVRPTEEDVAGTVEKISQLAPRLVPGSIRQRWAGLRTFAPDARPVVGEDPRLAGFFWLAGQGGFGIETSPMLGQLAAELLLDGRSEWPDLAALSPTRFV